MPLLRLVLYELVLLMTSSSKRSSYHEQAVATQCYLLGVFFALAYEQASVNLIRPYAVFANSRIGRMSSPHNLPSADRQHQVTGQLGSVMSESSSISLTCRSLRLARVREGHVMSSLAPFTKLFRLRVWLGAVKLKAGV